MWPWLISELFLAICGSKCFTLANYFNPIFIMTAATEVTMQKIEFHFGCGKTSPTRQNLDQVTTVWSLVHVSTLERHNVCMFSHSICWWLYLLPHIIIFGIFAHFIHATYFLSNIMMCRTMVSWSALVLPACATMFCYIRVASSRCCCLLKGWKLVDE